MIVRGGILDESDVITSPYNHFNIMRTHRWPYGPCFQLSFLICYITAREDAKADFLKAKFVSGPYLSIHNLICWKGEFEQGDKRK